MLKCKCATFQNIHICRYSQWKVESQRNNNDNLVCSFKICASVKMYGLWIITLIIGSDVIYNVIMDPIFRNKIL